MKRFVFGLTAVLALATAALISRGESAAQVPPLPTTRYLSTFAVSKVPAQYEIVHQILDFAPGAMTREHSHGGDGFVTVLEGQSGRREGNVETLHGPGQTYTEPQGVIHSARAVGGRLRVYASFLLSPGMPQTLNVPDAPIPAILPTTPFISRTTVGTQPAVFNLTQVVLDFGPGAMVPLHTHGGPALAMVIDGEIAFRTGTTEVRRTAGGTFVDVGEAHDARNVGAGTATVVVTYLIPPGAAITSFVSPATSPVTPSPAPVSPPRTGDAGLASDGTPWTALSAILLCTAMLSGPLAVRVVKARRRSQ